MHKTFIKKYIFVIPKFHPFHGLLLAFEIKREFYDKNKNYEINLNLKTKLTFENMTLNVCIS